MRPIIRTSLHSQLPRPPSAPAWHFELCLVSGPCPFPPWPWSSSQQGLSVWGPLPCPCRPLMLNVGSQQALLIPECSLLSIKLSWSLGSISQDLKMVTYLRVSLKSQVAIVMNQVSRAQPNIPMETPRSVLCSKAPLHALSVYSVKSASTSPVCGHIATQPRLGFLLIKNTQGPSKCLFTSRT